MTLTEFRNTLELLGFKRKRHVFTLKGVRVYIKANNVDVHIKHRLHTFYFAALHNALNKITQELAHEPK